MNTKVIASGLLLTLLSASSPLAARETASANPLHDIKLEKAGDHIALDMTIDPAAARTGSNHEVIFLPTIFSGQDSLKFTPFAISGRNRYYSHLRNGNADDPTFPVYRSGKGKPVSYHAELPWADWMENSRIIIEESMQDCCKPVKPIVSLPIAGISNAPQVWSMPAEPRYLEITDDSAVELEEVGKAYVDFIVNRTEIRDNYRDNAKELAKIKASIDKVKNDPEATIVRLSIKGYASPEGSYENNERLAMGRTRALKDYVAARYNFNPELIFADYEPEDWGGLRQWIVDNDISDKAGILGIIDSRLAPDPKNSEIQKRFPGTYKFLLDSVYPALRHSDYAVRYRIKTYASLDELKQAYAKNPERLRPVDFFRIAQSYSAGSPEAEEVLLKAAEMHPSDSNAAINAANIYLRHGETGKALKFLDNAGDSGEANFSRGLAQAAQGNYSQAMTFFEMADAQGIPQAAEEIGQMKRLLKDDLEITYDVPTKN